jgi:L-amino acid N-acyltransferase YncA
MVRKVTVEDAEQICAIYNHYVRETYITFEEQPVSAEEMSQRIRATLESLPWLVWENGQELAGYCYATRWKGRCAYRHSVESTVYVREGASGRGIGGSLYDALLTELRRLQLHTVIGGIALPNPASVALHEKLGFEKVAHFHEVGNKFNQWIDVGYWQLLLIRPE